MNKWDKAKRKGSQHYRVGDTQPVDLYRAVGAMQAFGLCNVIKYAYRCLVRGVKDDDLDKIVHYVELVRAAAEAEYGEPAMGCVHPMSCTVRPGTTPCVGDPAKGEPPCPNWRPKLEAVEGSGK